MTQEMLPVAILAGGLATRLRPLTVAVPKALVAINGEPFIAHQLRLLKANGIVRVVVCAGYLGEMIQECIGDGSAFGVQVRYAFDGPHLLGTAGALRQALPLLGEAFFVLYGDSYLPCDYRSVQLTFGQSRRLALMTVFRNDGRWDRSNVEFKGGRILAYNKRHPTPGMRHIDYGLGIFHHTAFTTVPEGQPHDLAMLYQELLAQDALTAYEVVERFYEIGSFAGLDEMRQYLTTRSTPARNAL
jgi:NDP-sugar pyrophosphorylase family protein